MFTERRKTSERGKYGMNRLSTPPFKFASDFESGSLGSPQLGPAGSRSDTKIVNAELVGILGPAAFKSATQESVQVPRLFHLNSTS